MARKRQRRLVFAARLKTKLFPFLLAPEIIARIFALGDFSEQDGARFALVTRKSTWQHCVRGVLWRQLDLTVCVRGPRTAAAGGICLHARGASRKTLAADELPERLAGVKELSIKPSKYCLKSRRCTQQKPLRALLASCAGLNLITITNNYKSFYLRISPAPSQSSLRTQPLSGP